MSEVSVVDEVVVATVEPDVAVLLVPEADISVVVEVSNAQGRAGENGDPGISAYDVAVANGFVGTESQWLTSLIGPAGGDLTAEELAALLDSPAAKAIPVDADLIPILDSASANALKKMTFANLKTWIKSWVTSTDVGLGSVTNDSQVKRSEISAFGFTLVDDTDAATARSTMGLGSASTHADTDFATATQGSTADSAVQPGDLPLFGDIVTRGASEFATSAQGSTADSAVQPADLPTFGDIVTHSASEFSASGHNHTGVYDPAGSASAAQSAAEADATTKANAKVSDAIVDGVLDVAPSQNAVLDALAGKGTASTKADVGLSNVSDDAQVKRSEVSTFAFTVLDDTDAATMRGTMGLGSASTTASTDYATSSQGSAADSAVQPGDLPMFDTDVTLAANSDGRVPTQKAIKAYVATAGGGISPTTVDAKGDLIVGTAADTVGRLAVGSDYLSLVPQASSSTGLAYATPTISRGSYMDNSYYLLTKTNGAQSTTTVTTAANTITFWLIEILEPITVDGLFIYVNTGAASAKWRIGMYAVNSATGKPTGTPIFQDGEIDASTGSTYKTDSFTVSSVLAPGLYAAAMASSSSSTAYRISSTTPIDLGINSTINYSFGSLTAPGTYSSGCLPVGTGLTIS